MASDETITLTPSPTAPFAAGPVVVPRELGTIRLHREIGRGGMGAVWLGQDRLLGRQVAVKFLLHAVADETDPHFVRFLEGARLAAAVKHAGLTTLHHADLTGGVPYLVMEHVDGPSLHQLTKRTGALSLPESLAVLQSVCEAVGELHDREIVHRDIKPANVLLDRDGRIYVTDFGLVCPRVTSAGSGDRPQTIAGTPPYMAPEMFDGAVSLRSDVYALGMMAYELLSGRLPFEGSLERLVELHRHAPLPGLFLSGGGDGSALEEVLQRATHKEATYRYKTARHFLRALREAVRDSGVWSQGPSLLASRIARFYRDSKTPHTSEPPTPSPTPYFQRLTELASRKHQSPAQTEALQAAPVEQPVEPTSSISFDVTCVHCGYNLRGLTPDGKCPECGKPIADSLREDRLMFADRKWLSRMALGQRLLLVAAYGALLPFLLLLLLEFSAPGYPDRLLGNPIASFTYRAVIVVALGGILLGILLATTPEPVRGNAVAPSPIRRIARFSAWCGLATLLLIVIAGFAGAGKTIENYFWVRHLLLLYACFCGYVGHAANLATRVPDMKRVKEARMVTGLMTALFLCTAVLLLLKEFAAFMPLGKPTLFKAYMILAAFVAFLALLRGLSLSDVLRRHIKKILAAPSALHAERPPEPVASVRENPLNDLLVRGLPELDLFETDLQRRLALTDLPKSGMKQKYGWRALRTRRSWLGIGALALILFAGFQSLKLIFGYFGVPRPLARAVGFLWCLVVWWFVMRWNNRRIWQEALRLRLLEQNVPVCLGCGYCLRGLPLASARCPECGRPFDDRVRELLRPPAVGSTPSVSALRETWTIHARGRARRAMFAIGTALFFVAVLTVTLIQTYPPMQGRYWISLTIGMGLLGFIFMLVGQRRYRLSPREAEPAPPSAGPSPEPALTVRAIPWESSLRGLPEMELFESDVQRQLAMTDLYQTSAEWKRDWRLSRLIRTRRFWLNVCLFIVILLACLTIAEFINKFILKRLGAPAPMEYVIIMVASLTSGFLFNLLRGRRPLQEALRLKLLQQGVPVCLGCGYCLRGLPLERARCPECGRPFDDRVRELLSQASAGLPGAGSTPLAHKPHETQAMKRKRRVRGTIYRAGSAMIFMGILIGPIVKAYLPMQAWQPRALSLGFILMGIILMVIGYRRYRISP